MDHLMGHPLAPLYDLLKEQVFDRPGTEELFNPWMDLNSTLDLPNAVEIRRMNYARYLTHFKVIPPVLIVSEAPGPRGCRFSGVPFTSERQLLDPTFPYQGEQSSRSERPYVEPSGTVFRSVLAPYDGICMVWNSVPYHPFQKGKPLSIRTPRLTERRIWAPVLEEVIRILQPRLILAVGRIAAGMLDSIGREARYIRHPSQGGGPAFREGMVSALSAYVMP